MAVATKVGGLCDVESRQQKHDDLDLSKPWDDGNVTFKIDGKKIYASKPVLSIWSPVFKAMLKGEFKEGSSEEITLPGKKHSSIMELFNICHIPGYEVNEENVTDLLPLAREYQMETVLKFCEKFLLNQAPSVRNLLLAKEYRFTTLENACMKYAMDATLGDLKKEDDFVQMDSGACAEFLSCKLEKYERVVEAVKYVKQVMLAGTHFNENRCQRCHLRDHVHSPIVFQRPSPKYVLMCAECLISGFQKIMDSSLD